MTIIVDLSYFASITYSKKERERMIFGRAKRENNLEKEHIEKERDINIAISIFENWVVQ